MDLRMPRCDGVEATQRLADARPEARVIALTTYADEPTRHAARCAPARAATSPRTPARRRSTARSWPSRAARRRSTRPCRPTLVAAVADGGEAPPLPDGLTPREAEVLTLIADGLSNAQIAERLVVSPATVKSHVNRVFAKAGVRDRAQAVAYAYRNGLAS